MSNSFTSFTTTITTNLIGSVFTRVYTILMDKILKNKYVFSLLGLILIGAFVNFGGFIVYYLIGLVIPELNSLGVEMGGLVFYLPIALILLIPAIYIFSKVSKRVLGPVKSTELVNPIIFWVVLLLILNTIVLPIVFGLR